MMQRITFRQIVQSVISEANNHLWTRAMSANAIAKITRAKNRDLAYDVKHKAIGQAIDRGHASVDVDLDRHPGLLSVGINGAMRLHTHEAWLPTGWHSSPSRNCEGQ